MATKAGNGIFWTYLNVTQIHNYFTYFRYLDWEKIKDIFNYSPKCDFPRSVYSDYCSQTCPKEINWSNNSDYESIYFDFEWSDLTKSIQVIVICKDIEIMTSTEHVWTMNRNLLTRIGVSWAARICGRSELCNNSKIVKIFLIFLLIGAK